VSSTAVSRGLAPFAAPHGVVAAGR
jgi:hypothetical protein